MKNIILELADIVNRIHDLLERIFFNLGYSITDKDLHFWIMGIIGMFTFFFVFIFFKLLENVKYKITIFSFIYTFTIMVILVFAIEIQQGITHRGSMEFSDAVIGLWGFVVFFLVYIAIALIIYLLVKSKRKKK